MQIENKFQALIVKPVSYVARTLSTPKQFAEFPIEMSKLATSFIGAGLSSDDCRALFAALAEAAAVTSPTNAAATTPTNAATPATADADESSADEPDDAADSGVDENEQDDAGEVAQPVERGAWARLIGAIGECVARIWADCALAS